MFELSSLKPSVVRSPYRMIIYGRAGLGKSTFASQAPNPIFADIENGTKALPVCRLPVELDANGKEKPWSWKHFKLCLIELYKQQHQFETLVIDSLDWLTKLIIEHVIETYNEGKPKENWATSLQDLGGYGHGYLLLDKEVTYLVNALSAIRDKHKMNIILTAHEYSEGKIVKDLVHGEYERYDMKSDSKRVNATMTEWCDYVFRAAQDLKVKLDGPKKPGAKGKAEYKDRILYTRDLGPIHAKRRIEMPDIIDLDYAAFKKAEDDAYIVQEKTVSRIFADDRSKPVDGGFNGANVPFEKVEGIGAPVSFV